MANDPEVLYDELVTVTFKKLNNVYPQKGLLKSYLRSIKNVSAMFFLRARLKQSHG